MREQSELEGKYGVFISQFDDFKEMSSSLCISMQ